VRDRWVCGSLVLNFLVPCSAAALQTIISPYRGDVCATTGSLYTSAGPVPNSTTDISNCAAPSETGEFFHPSEMHGITVQEGPDGNTDAVRCAVGLAVPPFAASQRANHLPAGAHVLVLAPLGLRWQRQRVPLGGSRKRITHLRLLPRDCRPRGGPRK
jgi:hypothetical protein